MSQEQWESAYCGCGDGLKVFHFQMLEEEEEEKQSENPIKLGFALWFAFAKV